MPIFAVFEVSDPEHVRSQLNLYHRDRFHEVTPGTFFVVTEPMSSSQFGDRLELSQKRVKAIIVPVRSYWGYHDRSLWEWIEQHWERHA